VNHWCDGCKCTPSNVLVAGHTDRPHGGDDPEQRDHHGAGPNEAAPNWEIKSEIRVAAQFNPSTRHSRQIEQRDRSDDCVVRAK
jgi:hypothetical protein